jgi:hypothetical protein
MTEEKQSLNDLPHGDEIICTLGVTPVTWQGWIWLPVTQLMGWIVFSRSSARRNPERSGFRALVEGFLQMLVTLGAEWGHNLAHLAASNWIGKPMNEFRIQFGMPRCIYHEINDRDVSPRQHIIRALGGPIFNLLVQPFLVRASRRAKPGSIAGTTTNTALKANRFLSLVSLLPIPGIDGGPILKWSLVEHGRTIQEADEIVRKVNGPLALLLGLFSSRAFGKKNMLGGFFSALLGLISLSIYAGWIKEEDLGI